MQRNLILTESYTQMSSRQSYLPSHGNGNQCIEGCYENGTIQNSLMFVQQRVLKM